MSIHRARKPFPCMIGVAVAGIVVLGRLTGTVALGANAASSANTWLNDPNGLLSPHGGVTGELIFKTVASLVVVLGLGVAAAWLLRRVGPRLCRIPGKEIRILETTALGPKKALHVVEVGRQRFLIGSTSEHVTLVSLISPSTSQERPPSDDPGRGI